VGSIPNVKITWIHIGCFTARLAQSVERTTLNERSFFLFFFVWVLFFFLLHAGKFWASLGKVGPSYVRERGRHVTR
jgi:predicted PurR-regulated permease PerM